MHSQMEVSSQFLSTTALYCANKARSQDSRSEWVTMFPEWTVMLATPQEGAHWLDRAALSSACSPLGQVHSQPSAEHGGAAQFRGAQRC